MSNVFNQELQDAIKGVYTLLENNELQQKNLTQGAKLSLYFAHGQTEKASNKLITDQQKSKETGEELQEATDASETCNNIVTAATAASTDARNTNSSASTAAVNIQAAANSLTNLAADVAAVLAVATSKDYDSKIQKLAARAYKLTQAASEAAEATTLQSLNTTIVAAQSRASVALTQSKTLAADTTSLLNALNTNFTALQSKIDDDSAALATAINTESVQDGVYQIAKQEEEAMQFSEEFINKEANYDVKYVKEGTDGMAFGVSFNSFNRITDEEVAGGKTSIKEYRIIFTLEDDAPAFDLHSAKNTEHFYSLLPASLSPTRPPDYKVDFITAENPKAKEEEGDGKTLNIAKDNTGKAVLRGNPYVVFVYVVFDCDYQNEMGNTDGFLSLASLPFTLQTLLPVAKRPVLSFYQHITDTGTQCGVSNAVRVSFKVPNLMFNGVDLSEITDFRVIIFNQEGEFASKLNHYTDEQLDKLAQLDEQYRLTEQAYLDARQAYKTAIATGEGDLEELKEALAIAQENYKEAAEAYKDQQEVIDNLYMANLSKFFIDTDILKQIPEAFTLPSKIIDKNYVKVQKEELLRYNGVKAALTTEQTNLTGMQTKLNDSLNDLNTTNAGLDKEIKALNKKLEDSRTDVQQGNAENAHLLNEYLDLENEAQVQELIKALPVEAAVITKLSKLFTEIKNIKAEIAKKAKELSANEKLIRNQQQDLVPIEAQLENVDDQLKSVDYNIEVFTKEIAELEAGSVSADLAKIKKTLNQLRATLKEIEGSEKPSAAQLKTLKKEIKDLEKEEKDLEADSKTVSESSLTRQFIAVNEDGSFTDNYGETMITGETYTALVFSVIKSSEPEAIPLFQTIYSPFSKGRRFTLPQL